MKTVVSLSKTKDKKNIVIPFLLFLELEAWVFCALGLDEYGFFFFVVYYFC